MNTMEPMPQNALPILTVTALRQKSKARSTIGSGDSMVAGLAIAFNDGRTFAEGLRLGTAAGAATAMTLGTRLCEARAVRRLEGLVKLDALRVAKEVLAS